MADANGTEHNVGPPLQRREADLIWHAPAAGLSGRLLFLLFMYAALLVVLLMSKMVLLAFTVLGTLVLLVIFSQMSAAHLIGPCGLTIQRPFGAVAQPWSAFAGWRRHGADIQLVFEGITDKPPLLLHKGQHADDVIKWLDYYLDELPEETIPADG